MNILMICPSQGGIDVYAKTMAHEFETLGVSVTLKHTPKSAWPYDPETRSWKSSSFVKQAVVDFAKTIDFSKYDLTAFHFGSIDPEQYLPFALNTLGIRIPHPVYFVHILKHSLFDGRLGDPRTQREINKYFFSFFKNYFFFTRYALKNYRQRNIPIKRYIVGFLPETHFPSISNDPVSQKIQDVIKSKSTSFLISWVGHASRYKEIAALIKSLPYINRVRNKKISFLIFGRGWLKTTKQNYFSSHSAELLVTDKELNPSEFGHIIEHSDAGILLYQESNDTTLSFQGSGTLPNYVWNNKPMILANFEPLKEYAGNGAYYVSIKKKDAHKHIAKAVENLIVRNNALMRAVRQRRYLFDRSLHAKQCLSFFEHVVRPRA